MSTMRLQRLVAVFEILGGAYGFIGGGVTLIVAFSHGSTGVVEAAAFLITLSACSIVGGVELYRGNPLGRDLSTAVQAAQTPLLAFHSVHYSAFLLARITISWGSEGLAFGAGLGGEYIVHWSSPADAPTNSVGLNVLAMGFLIFVLLLRRQNRPAETP